MYKRIYFQRGLCGLVILLCVLSLSSRQGAAKQSVQERADTTVKLAKVRFHKPKLTLQNALKKAEKFIASNKISIEDYYLFEARFMLYDPDNEKVAGWRFWWVHQDRAMGNYVEIFVSMEGQIKRLPSM